VQNAARKEGYIMIPTEEDCYALMDQYQMLDNIREHSILVAKIVKTISQRLVDAGVQISIEKAVAGALLHDIAKTSCLQTDGDHSALGKKICLQHQLDEIADIVGEHVRLRNSPIEAIFSEKEIVYYADKRVLHSSVVSLEERMRDILDRYGRDNHRLCQLIRENFDICRRVERKLFEKLDLGPDDLEGLIGNL
jgi:putative nucleotidyltransferase with HDIG domain